MHDPPLTPGKVPTRQFAPLSAADRDASIAQMLSRQEAYSSDLWLFGYGSLMWKPEPGWLERRPAQIVGYSRCLNVWTVQARGSLEHPGLGFGLEPSAHGRCVGWLYLLEPEGLQQTLQRLWAREMHTGVYRPEWVQARVVQERSASAGVALNRSRPLWTPAPTALDDSSLNSAVRAFTFVVNPGHAQYAGRWPVEQAAAMVAKAKGQYGYCRDYVAAAINALEALGHADPDLDELWRRIQTLPDNHPG